MREDAEHQVVRSGHAVQSMLHGRAEGEEAQGEQKRKQTIQQAFAAAAVKKQ